MIYSILKPNCTTDTLLETAVGDAKRFTKNDTVIIWLDKAANKIKSQFILTLTDTQTPL